MFFKFQKEVKALANVCCVVKSEFGDCLIYEVIDEGHGEEDYKFKVFFNRADKKASCVCRLFEFAGLICRHILCVFKQERIKKVEPCYLVERWSKTKEWPHLENFEVGVANRLAADGYNELFSKLHELFTTLVQEGAQNDEVRAVLVNGLTELHGRIQSVLSGCGHSNGSTVVNLIEESSDGSTPTVKNPPFSSSKGRPRKKGRLRSWRSPIVVSDDNAKNGNLNK
jgi:hypothetical protein